jgi:very-short-patch-repair endonuclease
MSDARPPHVPTNPILLGRARTMRHDPSRAEEILWQMLRGRRLGGFKFRRQVPRGCFIADFYCHEAGLVVELDGETHDGRDAEDEVRTQILERDGYQVVRFRNADVFGNVRGVLARIHKECERLQRARGGDNAPQGRKRPHPGLSNAPQSPARPHPGPLPGGEGA